ncbi:MAG: hypothetical protein PVJ67_06700 [Candidatus Pacearchaeota archaeon]|jgi:hypothetical protein
MAIEELFEELFEELYNLNLQKNLKDSTKEVRENYDKLKMHFKNFPEIRGALIEIAPFVGDINKYIETYNLLQKEFPTTLSIEETTGLIRCTANYINTKSIETFIELFSYFKERK